MSNQLDAPVVAVTVLEDRAAITRRGSIALRPGQQRIVIERVSPVLADKTLTASAAGARVLDVRCERYVAPWRESSEGVDGLRAERAKLAARHDAAAARVQLAAAELGALAKVSSRALGELAVHATRGAAVERAAAQLAELDTDEAAARERRAIAQLEQNDLANALARLDTRIARAEGEAGEHAARLVIDLVAEAAGDATVTATYIVPGAAWRPYHRAQLARDTGKLDWQVTACVWQATGEDWRDVELHCSLERPSLGSEPPDLVDDELHTRKKPETFVVEAREQEQQTTGLGGGGADTPRVPGIDDGGFGVRLAAGRVSVKPDGAPHRVPVGGFQTTAKLELVAIPLRSPWVHVRARFANTGTVPLLAGPVDLILASGYVGRTDIGFVAPGEQVDVGFGPESEIRAHRSETREQDEVGLTTGFKNVQTVRVAVRLSNLGARAREVVVTERVPVSEVEQVQIQVAAENAYKLKGEDVVTARMIDDGGLVMWQVALPPHGRRAVTLEYKLKSNREVAGI